MPDIQDELNVSERILNEKYEENVVYLEAPPNVREMAAVQIKATAVVEKVANGLMKLRLRNIEVDGELKYSNLIQGAGKHSVTVKVDF